MVDDVQIKLLIKFANSNLNSVKCDQEVKITSLLFVQLKENICVYSIITSGIEISFDKKNLKIY